MQGMTWPNSGSAGTESLATSRRTLFDFARKEDIVMATLRKLIRPAI